MEITITCVWADDEKEITRVASSFGEAFARLATMEQVIEPKLAKKDEEAKKSDLVDSLTTEQEEKLKEAHAKDYHGTDDDMPDAFESWLEDLTYEQLKELI